MDRETAVSKIADLLAHAQGAGTSAEAEAFTQKAEQLMIRYEVDALTALKSREVDTAKLVQDQSLIVVNPLIKSQMQVVSAIVAGHNCKMYWTDRTEMENGHIKLTKGGQLVTSKVAVILGYEEDVQAATAYFYALMPRVLKEAQRTRPRGINWARWGSSFITGFASGLRTRFNQAQRAAMDQMRAQGEDLLPAVVRREQKVSEWYDTRTANIGLRNISGPRVTASSAYGAGIRAGMSTDIGRTRLVGGHKELGR